MSRLFQGSRSAALINPTAVEELETTITAVEAAQDSGNLESVRTLLDDNTVSLASTVYEVLSSEIPDSPDEIAVSEQLVQRCSQLHERAQRVLNANLGADLNAPQLALHSWTVNVRHYAFSLAMSVSAPAPRDEHDQHCIEFIQALRIASRLRFDPGPPDLAAWEAAESKLVSLVNEKRAMPADSRLDAALSRYGTMWRSGVQVLRNGGLQLKQETPDKIQAAFRLQNAQQAAIAWGEMEFGAGGTELTVAKTRTIESLASQTETVKQFRQIGVAMHKFQESHRRFPSAKGNLSWRVSLLPFLNEQTLFEQFRLDEPWDSPHNRSLIPSMPNVFATKRGQVAGTTTVHVFCEVEQHPFYDVEGIRFANLTDGATSTLMLIDAGPEYATEWTRPGGLGFGSSDTLDPLGLPGPNGWLSVMFDASVRLVPIGADPAKLRLLIEYGDGESLGGFTLPRAY